MTSAELDVRRSNYQLIEKELYNYDQSVQELEEYFAEEKAIYYPGKGINATGIIPKNAKSDPTGQQGLKLAGHHISTAVMRETARRVRAIDWAYNTLPESHKKLIKLKYWSRRRSNPDRLAMELKIDRATYFRWRNEIVALIAERLGWKI